MKKHFRRVIFIVFVCSFFATAGSVTLYTLGYRYSMERGVFIYTGSVTIQANPETVAISVDNAPAKADINQLNGSYHIAGLEPGEHTVEISAEGFNPWAKKFIVNSGISTEFWNIMLTRKEYPEASYATLPVYKVFPSPKSTLLAYVSTPDSKGFSVNTLDTETDTTTPVFSTQDSSFDRNAKENIEWSIDADYISIPTESDGKKNYFIVNSDTKDSVGLHDASGLDDLRMVRWDSSRNTFLLALSGNTLYEIDIANPSDKKALAQNVQSYDISGNDLYILETSPSDIVYKTSITNLDAHIQITTLPAEDAQDDRFSVIAYDENRIMLINYFTGKLIVYNKNDTDIRTFRLDSNAKGAQFSDDGKKLLYWTDREMFVYFTRNWETQPLRDAGSSLTIGRLSQAIDNVHWAKDYEHVTFSVGNDIKLMELDNRGEKSIMDIISLPNRPTQILSNFAEDMLFYTVEGASSDRQILRSIDFPEKTLGIFSPRR